MTAPKRIQRKRTKGWRMPEGAVYVGRPSRWGNPFPIDGPEQPWLALALGERADRPGRQRAVVKAFRWWIVNDGTLPPIGPGDTSASPGGELEYADGSRRRIADIPSGMGLLMLTANGPYQFGPADRPDLAPLRGLDLVCWCAITYEDGTIVPCHADVLLELANRGEAGGLRGPDGEDV